MPLPPAPSPTMGRGSDMILWEELYHSFIILILISLYPYITSYKCNYSPSKMLLRSFVRPFMGELEGAGEGVRGERPATYHS